MLMFLVLMLGLGNPGADISVEGNIIYIEQSDGMRTAVKVEEISENPPHIEYEPL